MPMTELHKKILFSNEFVHWHFGNRLALIDTEPHGSFRDSPAHTHCICFGAAYRALDAVVALLEEQGITLAVEEQEDEDEDFEPFTIYGDDEDDDDLEDENDLPYTELQQMWDEGESLEIGDSRESSSWRSGDC